MNKIIVVSLFDGISIGKKAFVEIEHPPLRYYSSEIDENAIAVADYHFPEDSPYRLGDVRTINGKELRDEIEKEFGKEVKILLIGGSPCTDFSFSGRMEGMVTEDKREVHTLSEYLDLKEKGFKFKGESYLFWEYIRIKEELNPDLMFLENVKMSKKWKSTISKVVGFHPDEINSALVSAQNRIRNYWAGKKSKKNPNVYEKIKIIPPKNRGIKFASVLENAPFKEIPKCMDGYCGRRKRIFLCNWIKNEKSNTVTTVRSHTNQYLLNEDKTKARLLTLKEAERLQTFPDDYTKYGILYGKKYELNISSRYRLIGNSWTLEIIKHIFAQILKES